MDDLKDRSRWYSSELFFACLNSSFDLAQDESAKKEIVLKAKMLHAGILARGKRFCALLFYECAREGLKAMSYGSSPKDIRPFLQVYKDFSKYWDEHPEIHKATVLAEHLG